MNMVAPLSRASKFQCTLEGTRLLGPTLRPLNDSATYCKMTMLIKNCIIGSNTS